MKHLFVALAAGGLVATGFAHSAHASALGFASANFQNVTISRDDGSLFSQDSFSVLEGSTEYSATGSYNGDGITTFTDVLSFNQTNAFEADIGAFSVSTSGGPDGGAYSGMSYMPPLPRTDGLSDQLVGSASQLEGNVLREDGANIRLNNVVSLPDPARGTALGSVGLSSDFSFQVDEATELRLTFDLDLVLRAFLGQDQQTANSRFTFTFTLFDSVGNPIAFTFDDDNPFSLTNIQLTANTETAGDGLLFDGSGSFGLTTAMLNPNETHRLGIGVQQITSGEWEQVPEPASIALFGLGLLGLGIVMRRRATF
ncbi:EDSAP-1 family PEP-CTERM protein [Ectothiorhodospira variabilis]|uniref:EDSAP-1 family PEP-CTERM protein n=1 Tax=Ectothiorhodospira variabilis TaxID=505694 RepID=UPI001EFBD8EC|nr:EDSAP-1 family PEP-CTERM protein [Ectothiorhodospira variabilis]MCG5495950.1 PEP-CTERM sorting domain-containing protein [Ectothiorhodospira variabilis]MCG5505362.1 PEP-CTERM sorting domain-containing protein [Ectothiorhodospira variabilis]MCG5508548.1 PEP-CTERM sorting domain-containing protein [Ectothiorhodospira variabilis]